MPILSILNLFSGPIGGLVEKGILAGVTYLFAAGHIQGDTAGVAAGLYGVFSILFTALTGSQTAKIQSVNTASNGVWVVPASAASQKGLRPVEGPLDDSRMGSG